MVIVLRLFKRIDQISVSNSKLDVAGEPATISYQSLSVTLCEQNYKIDRKVWS